MHRYTIRITGALSPRREAQFGCVARWLPNRAESRLRTEPLDQAGLHGLLAALRDAGVELIAVHRIPTRRPGTGTTNGEPR